MRREAREVSSKNELDFRTFSKELLAAEETVHRSGEVTLYSSEALQKILCKFSDIVADDLQAQSCTIQLKLHDIRSCKFLDDLSRPESTATAHRRRRSAGCSRTASPADERSPEETHRRSAQELSEIDGYRGRVQKRFVDAWKIASGNIDGTYTQANDPGEAGMRRDLTLRSAHVFPYCVYPKGAMWLAAANDGSPWTPFVGWLITDLQRGVTAEIVQEKSARVRDPFSMRKTRYFRKLGEIDPYLWTNRRPLNETTSGMSPRYFFNYYAVPIRIHSSGDVIGIIKIENKGFASDSKIQEQLHQELNRVLAIKHTNNVAEMVRQLDTTIGEVAKKLKSREVEIREPSILSLVYLAHDLAACAPRRGPRTIESFLTESYRTAARAAADSAAAPPVQVLFDSVTAETEFFKWLARTDDHAVVLAAVRHFYQELNTALSKQPRIANVRVQVERTLKSILRGRGARVEVKPAGTEKPLPDFFYDVKAAGPTGDFVFHVQVCPSRVESSVPAILARYWDLPEGRAAAYAALHREQRIAAELNGEYIEGSDRIIHLPTDRLAARVQALTYAFPIPEFTAADSWKLSWAALEIGKLIERQISYRGTHSDPTVPLTSDDFFRVPISDLSFVDAVRQQYNRAQAALNSLHYHMPNMCRDLNFTWGITLGERIKTFRSYFDRLGQAHRAQEDAVIALWTYMLAERLDRKEWPLIEQQTPALARRLRALKKDMDALWTGAGQTLSSGDEKRRHARFVHWKHSLKEWLASKKPIIPDLNFGTPALSLDEGRRKEALLNLRKNLSGCPSGISDSMEWSDGDLVELLYRRYDPFVAVAVSLYLQLRNQTEDSRYLAFYKETREILDDLRSRLESLEEQVTRAPQEDRPIGRLSASLGELRVEVLSLPTREFAAIFGHAAPDAELLGFSVQGIYKRIRTLANVSGNQSSPGLLNWDSGRFDYLGSRLTCLFKNQVFAVYEEVWERGDPFRMRNVLAATAEGTPAARQRWLCLRTKVHSGTDGYNAWQVSALMDPEAVNENYWRRGNPYTLKELRRILVNAYRKWHPSDAEKYERLASVRLHLQNQYSNWFAHATDVLDQKEGASDMEQTFGHYLGESALDWLAYVLKVDSDLRWRELTSISKVVGEFVAVAFDYSVRHVTPVIHARRGTYDPGEDALLIVAHQLYEYVREVLERCPKLGRELIRKSRARLRVEYDTFASRAGPLQVPIVYVNANVAQSAVALQRWIRNSRSSRQNAGVCRSKLKDLVRHLQGCQMDYLFDLPVRRDGYGTFRADAPLLRGQADVMDRILCYLLLHRPAEPHTQSRPTATGTPHAYDLFYYLMSLIPVEIQVRTALANTIAEQYHKIYKGGKDAVTAATMIPQERLKGIGQELDLTDREFEVQFEDYIVQLTTADAAEQASAK